MGFRSLIDMISSVVPIKTLHTTEEVHNYVESIFKNNTNLIDGVVDMIANDIRPGAISDDIIGFSESVNSMNNTNQYESKKKVYPQADSKDPLYGFSEEELRGSIHIPSGFQYENGSKQPVILVLGTGSTGGLAYSSNIGKLLKKTDYADIVWLNIPGYLLDDAQNNAEYVAYAINYISGITNKNVSVISWSQGGLDTQWALKYWPSTRSKVSNFIPISMDLHGTTMAYLLCPAYPLLGCNPSVLQQEYNSEYIKTIRSDDDDSAFVPTTSIFSGFDEVVEPQSGKNASAYFMDVRGVGVTNNEVQILCPSKPGGSFYTHEGMLYNPVTYAFNRARVDSWWTRSSRQG